jgi:hypothetical protein
MNRLPALLVVGLVAGCGGDDGDDASGGERRRTGNQLGQSVSVPGQANIYGAGQKLPPQPAGGGPGVPPPVWRLPDGEGRVVTVPRATGFVNPIAGEAADNGPGGDGEGATDVTSYKGISGIVHDTNGMFLVGVFLTDAPAAGKAPPILDFSKRERFSSLAPRIGQTFFIGDGKGRSYRVPPDATRLFLGFADGYLYAGPPGWYGNNRGKLRVTVEMTDG